MAGTDRPRLGAPPIRRAMITAGLLCLAAVAAPALAGCDPRSGLTPRQVIEGFAATPDLPATNPRDVTSERCGDGGDDVGCEEAVQADELTVYSFAEKKDAAAFARSLGRNGYQSDWIVLEYDNAAADTDEAKASYATQVDGTWTSD